MADFVGHAPLTIVTLKSGAQKYVYGPVNGSPGDAFPEDAAEGEKDRLHARGFVGAEDEEFDHKTGKWSKKGKAAMAESATEPKK